MIELHEVSEEVGWTDHEAENLARQRQAQLTKPHGALGRLEELAEWVSGVQGQCPPHDFERARVVIFAGDHGVAQSGVSAYPPKVTAQMVANFVAGGAAVNALASVAGATVRVVDISVDADTAEDISRFKIRRSSGRIDREDALTEEQTSAAIDAGIRLADEEIDGGADLLIVGDMGIGNTTPAATIISVITSTEPVKVVGRGTGIDDNAWMRKTTAIRDARARSAELRWQPVELLRTVGGADIAAMAGFLLRASARRTPVLLDGLVVCAAALIINELQPRAGRWWQAAHLSTEPAHAMALTRLGLKPLVDLGMRLGEGSGALVALPIVRAAVATLSQMATFEEAGVSLAGADDEPESDDIDAESADTDPTHTDPTDTEAEPTAIASDPEPEAVEQDATSGSAATQPPA